MIAAGRAAPEPSVQSAAAPRCAVHLVPLEPGLYVFRLAAAAVSQDPRSGLAVPAVQLSEPPAGAGAIAIRDAFGGVGTWLGGRHEMLFVSVPTAAKVLVTAHLGDAPVELEISRIDTAAASPPPGEKLRLTLAAPDAAPPPPQQVALDAVAHIRGRGDMRFVDAAWIGRLGHGSWIEALTLAPRDPAAAAVVEYKGLIAGGAETPWTSCGAPCGTQGRGLPLIGIAIRQKAGSGEALFDCEYAGYFQSGATAGPARNGAPCRSATDGDPLEGLQLRISRRSPPTDHSKIR